MMGQVKKRLREKESWRKGGRETEKVREDTDKQAQPQMGGLADRPIKREKDIVERRSKARAGAGPCV